MPSPWLLALKVIPWGDVIEHAPKVLSAARKLVERQREQRQASAEPPASPASPDADRVPMPLEQLQTRLDFAHERIASLQQAHDQLTQTVAELAEQNARLVSAVELLRLRTRMLLAAVAVGAIALIALWWR